MNNGGESCYWTEVAWIELTIWKWNRQINVLLQSAHYGTNDFSKAVSPLFVFTRRLWHHSAHYIRTRESRLPAIAVEYRRFVGTNCQSDKLQTGKNSTFILFSTFEERILIWDWSAWSVFLEPDAPVAPPRSKHYMRKYADRKKKSELDGMISRSVGCPMGRTKSPQFDQGWHYQSFISASACNCKAIFGQKGVPVYTCITKTNWWRIILKKKFIQRILQHC